MHTDSSAMATCLRLRSTVLCTATVLMPSAWQARRMRSAISPRLAMTTFFSMAWSVRAASGDHEHRLVELDRLAGGDQDRAHGAGDFGLDGIEHLHRLDDSERLARLYRLPDLHEGRRIRVRRGVVGADHRGADHVAVGHAVLGLGLRL